MVSSPFSTIYLITSLGSETLEVRSVPGGTQSSPHPELRPTSHKPALSPWDQCPNITHQGTLSKTLPLSKLYVKCLWDRENYNKVIMGGGLLWTQVKLSHSYNILIILGRIGKCWFSSILSSIQGRDFNFGLFQHSSATQRWLHWPTDNMHCIPIWSNPWAEGSNWRAMETAKLVPVCIWYVCKWGVPIY